MHPPIDDALDTLERERGIRVLYAAESGSRAWGFASPDSDYDVRFIYVHPLRWYLRVSEARDVLEAMLPGDLDLSGWDLRKALRLYAGCNLPLNEWLGSPLVYREHGPLASQLRARMSAFFRPSHALFHYLNTARHSVRDHLNTETVRLKKVFYALRPLLACRWIEHARSQPPTAFADLVAADWVSLDERVAIGELLRVKENVLESDRSPLSPWWRAWLTQSIEHFEAIAPTLATKREMSMHELDALLQQILLSSGD